MKNKGFLAEIWDYLKEVLDPEVPVLGAPG